MLGCSLQKICKDDDFMLKTTCSPFSVLANLCQKNPEQPGCKERYAKLCSRDSVVKQCSDNPPLVYFSDTKKVEDLVDSICTNIVLNGCKTRLFTTDKMKLYSDLCISMSEMPQCKEFKSMCSDLGSDFPYCAGDLSASPYMLRYLHSGLSDYIMFRKWVPSSSFAYGGAFFAVITLGILYECLITVRSHCEASFSPLNISTLNEYSKRQLCIDAARCGLQFLETALAYALMIVSMTFNIGLFFAVILGLTIGTLIFARYRFYGNPKKSCGC
ncbi:hypothetical protein DSO57_1025106 [Entomophthora muscae]|uniref:Uncharacterized protein n=1 Tax=Entomophthora muscae TaxID=34485 RepID=A0ACC2UBH9_9FUNG|nr:hypothetical protein DSO57_1025106 [Entomophthora muscae]